MWLSYLNLVVCIVSALVVTFYLTKIDSVVHVQLYQYGLQFSMDWAAPYWNSVQLIYLALGFPTVISIAVLGLRLIRSRKNATGHFAKTRTPVAKQKENFEIPKFKTGIAVREEELVAVTAEQESEHSEERDANPKSQGANGLLVSCPSCSKVFNRPLVMLDFSRGETRLVNICPYCNHTLGVASPEKKSF